MLIPKKERKDIYKYLFKGALPNLPNHSRPLMAMHVVFAISSCHHTSLYCPLQLKEGDFKFTFTALSCQPCRPFQL
jgi:hypothetical protein